MQCIFEVAVNHAYDCHYL